MMSKVNKTAVDCIDDFSQDGYKPSCENDSEKIFRNLIDFIKDQIAGVTLTLGARVLLSMYKKSPDFSYLLMTYAVIIAGISVTILSGLCYAYLTKKNGKSLFGSMGAILYIIISVLVVLGTAMCFSISLQP